MWNFVKRDLGWNYFGTKSLQSRSAVEAANNSQNINDAQILSQIRI